MGMLTSWLCSQQFLSGSSESSLQSCTAVHSAMGDAANVNDEGELKISGPLVFSCMKCRSIVGDSFSFMSSNEATRTITLAAASNINRTNDLFTSYESLDEGSTYFSVLCRECKETLGRYYVTTSSDLDDLREKFTFNIDAITSYELGKVQHGKRPEPAVLSFPVAEDAPSAAVTIEAVQEDVTKVQHVLVDLVQRFGVLEREHAALRRTLSELGAGSRAWSDGSGGSGAGKRLRDS